MPNDSLQDTMELVANNQRLNRRLQKEVFKDILGNSPATQRLRDHIRDAADDERSVLVQGEEGTETANVARAVHALGTCGSRTLHEFDCRRERIEHSVLNVFVLGPTATECATAQNEAPMLVTLLLHHVDALSQSSQDTLVTILDANDTPRDIAHCGVPVRLRVIATTHGLLKKRARNTEPFDVELWQQLMQITIRVPSLRERREDIDLLAEANLEQLAFRQFDTPKRLNLDALMLLRNHDWPGNLQELWRALSLGTSLTSGSEVTAENIQPWLQAEDDSTNITSMTLRDMERQFIEATFNQCGGNREQTARLLSIGVRTLSGKLRDYGYPPRGGPGSNRAAPQSKAA